MIAFFVYASKHIPFAIACAFWSVLLVYFGPVGDYLDDYAARKRSDSNR